MKLLSGSELAGFIKQRHAQQVRQLRESKIFPKLAIVQVKDDPVINTYVRLKKKYGTDIGVEVDIYRPAQKEVPNLLSKLNADKSVYGIIVQLPLEDPDETDEIVNLIAPQKDVDALGKNSKFQPATPTAILWLLAGHNVELKDKKVLLIGRGKLVGGPLEQILKNSGIDLDVADINTTNTKELSKRADVIIAAANAAGILTADMVKQGVIIVDAGTANEEGKTVGNAAADLYERDDITITPKKGGVGPLTVCALFENVIRAAQNLPRTKS
ncbi:bifunctional 5,10-methylenetetrahydrofolate dehydrogenase/5,10-methenyltetrahydrofolate cyclohydrolase [Candidatus Saccharibacteria bacterium]|nr:bifunctional 5,10-methylenetetrahydrofolate dehydrogenase/5,10-methenyltetrahydrofolate cyclohydrolase [Candidatus Saccharibacteria bacterium]